MAGDRIDLDELLAGQEQSDEAIRVTIEAIPDDESRVKVTPFVEGSGCSCARSLAVLKTAIESLTTTDQTHPCCGKLLKVVEIAFVDEALTDVFKQLSRPAVGHPHEPSALPAPQYRGAPMPAARSYPGSYPPPRSFPNRGGFYPPMPMPMARSTNEPFGTTNEIATGWYDDAVCAIRQVMCTQSCNGYVGPFSTPEDWRHYHNCICNCLQDHEQCLNPHHQRQPCEF